MIDEKKLIEEIESLSVTVNGLRAGKGILREFEKHYKESILRIIEEQPKVGDWIPCENELPKTNGVYQIIKEVKEGNVVYHIEGAAYFDGQNTWYNDVCINHGRGYLVNIIAWQPIQPYREGDTLCT